MNSLNDSNVVVRIQNYFGVTFNENNSSVNHEDFIISDSTRASQQVSNNNDQIKMEPNDWNGCKSRNSSGYNLNSENRNDYNNKSLKKVLIQNYFWYYLFIFSTELGDEIFYTTFIPFWLWNVDSSVGRRVVLVWAIIMTTGQALKDVICWPRPKCPPVIRLQNKWSEEYGMPSTHAAVSISIPLGIILFTKDKYVYPLSLGLTSVLVWSSLICLSRLYLGMHSLLDIIGGLLLALTLLIPLVPLANYFDYYLITNELILFVFIIITILTIIYYPTSDRWTSTRSDSSMVVAVTSGIYTGAYLNYKTGLMLPSLGTPPYIIMWPTYENIILLILRTIIGFICLMPIKFIFKSLAYEIICAIINVNSKELMKSENSLDNTYKTLAELTYKMLFCFTFGVSAIYILPIIFSYFGLLRPGFYTELN